MPDAYAPPAFVQPLTRGPGLAGPDALALAGSRYVRFDGVRDAEGQLIAAAALDPALRARLSAPPAPMAGLALDGPRVMGILNTTPDSFSDGGTHQGIEAALAHARAMLPYVDIIDLGGESTRPGAAEVPVLEEIARTAPVIRALRDQGISTPISIDTRKAAVAEAALDAGADIVNDVTAMRFDREMAALVAARDVPICLMHSVADPATMQDNPAYRDVVREVFDHLAERIEAAIAAGIRRENIITDPGVGFGKTNAHNLALTRGIGTLHALGCPILLGVSRKRYIGEITGVAEASERMAGSLAVALAGANEGVQILRVHDVKETAEALRMWRAMAGECERQ